MRALRGLTLAELIVAFGLMTLILLASIQLLTYLLASGGKNTASLVALQFATSKIEEEVAGASPGAKGVEKAYTLDPASNTQFYYEISRTPLSGDPNAATGAYLGGFTVTVQVWWNGDNASRARAGVGLQQVRLSRFVYPRTTVP